MSQGTRPAQQARSRQTRDRLVAALEALLREKDFEAITIADLAGRAGLSVGAVYRRFENKDAFIPVIFELYRVRLERHMTGEGRIEIDPADGLRAALHQIMTAAWSFLEQEGHLIRAAHLYARLRPDLAGDEWEALLAAALDSARQIVALFEAEIGVTDREEAAQMLAYLLNTLPIERGLYARDGVAALLTIPREAFIRAVADAIYGYLVSTPDPA